jgi:peptide/nickel transport system substrate-binding protein
MRFSRRLLAAVVAAATVVPLAACDLAGAASAPETPVKGGTLNVILQSDFDVLDPQRSYTAVGANAQRLFERTLTTYRSVPGSAASEIVGDLATDTGRPSEGNTVWEFTLKPGVRWEDGSPVTCQQVRYGVERRFSRDAIMGGGAPYPLTYLKDNSPDPYLGPWVARDNDGKGLDSIECVDVKTIRFHLKQPVGDFGYAVAMSVFAPVPPEKDTKEKYDRYVFSNGPYKIEPGSHTDKQMVLVPNPYWDPKTDQVRKQYADKIVFKFALDSGGAVTNELIDNQGDAQNTIMLDQSVAPNFLQQVVNDPDLLKRTVAGPTGAVRFYAINTERVTDPRCREALIYAFNKRKYRAVLGGSTLGDYATTIIPPDFKAHKEFDLFDSLTHPEGDVDAANDKIKQVKDDKSVKPCATKLSLAYPESTLRERLANTIVESYQRIGIQVVPHALAPDVYYTTGVGDPANKYDLIYAGWVADWGNGSAIIPPLFDGRLISRGPDGHGVGNIDFPLLNDKKINDQIDAALAESDFGRQWALWGDLDMQIQRKAVTIPVLYEKSLYLMGSNIRGAFNHPAFGMPDLVALGLGSAS